MASEHQTPTDTDLEGLIGADEHPPEPRDGSRRMIVSAVWGGVPMRVLTDHGLEATWLGSDYPEPCRLYAYSRGYCMTGCKHPGMDISMPAGTALHAITGGNVFQIRNPGVSGSIEVRVRTTNGHQHLYNHMSRSAVNKGQDVAAGDLLGFSGVANSPHLHFELRIPNADCRQGVAIVDPESLLVSGGDVSKPFAVGDRFRVTEELNLRKGAGTGHDIIAVLPASTTGTITGGPSSADGFTWWQVQTSLGEGWVAQNWIQRL